MGGHVHEGNMYERGGLCHTAHVNHCREDAFPPPSPRAQLAHDKA